MAWERVISNSTRSTKPSATVWSSGMLGFNKKAVQEYGMGAFDYAVVFVDKESKKLGIKLTNNQTEEGTRRVRKFKWGILVSIKSLLKSYKIIPLSNRKLPCQYSEKDDMVIVKYN